MAFQLVYTSAPKLLQAGRTGFGTVARHPALKGTLQDEIERISQFSRVAGLNAHRTIYAHRVLNIRGEVFNVISRIRDAGSDYTGRTNHIAHHIVVPASEAKHDLSPVDLIIHLEHSGIWRNSWEEGPREFSPEDEVEIAGFSKLIDLPATHWHPSKNAALPASIQYYESCWILHGGENTNDGTPQILWLLGESLLLTQFPWNVSFSTDIQPTERVEELRWKGVCNTSPMRAVALQSVRPTIDLSDFTALAEPDSKLALMAEYGRDAQVASSPTFQAVIYGQEEEESTENITSPLIRKGGKRQSMHGDSLRFGNQKATNPKKSRAVMNAIFISVPLFILLFIVGFFFIRSSSTFRHLNALYTSIQDPPFIEGEIQDAKNDWVYLFGTPSELTNTISAMSLYARAVQLWSDKDYNSALTKFEEAAKQQKDVPDIVNNLTDKLRSISNQKKQEFLILDAVGRIKNGTIQAALLPRADSKSSDITEIQHWNDKNRCVPGLSREQVKVLGLLTTLLNDRYKSTFYSFKESLRAAKDSVSGTDDLSKKINGWLDEQALEYAVNVLKQRELNSELLLQIVNARIIDEPTKKKALEEINKVVQSINNGSKVDQDEASNTIQKSLVELGVHIEESNWLNDILKKLPKAVNISQVNTVAIKSPDETLVPTVIVPSLGKLSELVDTFKVGDDSVSIGPVDAWLKPTNVENTVEVKVFTTFSEDVKKTSLQSGVGTVAWFHDPTGIHTPTKGDWRTANQIFLLPAASSRNGEGSVITIVIPQQLFSWDKESLTLSFNQKGKEIRDKLKTIDRKTFEYSVKVNGEPPVSFTDNITLSSKKQSLELEQTDIENQLKTIYNQESIRDQYKNLYIRPDNKLLNLGNLLTANLAGSSDKEKKKKTADKIALVQNFDSWLKNSKGIKDPSKVNLSLDPANGTLIGAYISSVFSTIDEEYALTSEKFAWFSGGQDPSRNLFDVVKKLKEPEFKIAGEPQKQYSDKEIYIRNLQAVFKDSAGNIEDLSKMFALAKAWGIASARGNKLSRLAEIQGKLKGLDKLTADDFQLSAEQGGTTIKFTKIPQ